MRSRMISAGPFSRAAAFFLVSFLGAADVAGATATIDIVNLDGAGVGFNDNTPAAPVGGNPGITAGEQRWNAFRHGADIWESLIESDVTITVEASWNNSLFCDKDSAILGAAGPNTAHGNWDCSVLGAPGCLSPPFPDTWYVQSLANSLAGADLDPDTSDMSSEFNPDIGTAGCLESCGWYYGFDRNASGCDIDFTATILHEMGHGLGFVSLVDLDTGEKFGGYDDAYMIHLEDHSTGLHYPVMSNGERVAASTDTGDLHWTGDEVVAASGLLADGAHASGHVEMYAPNPKEYGSSVSHFSTSLSPNELMEPFYTEDAAMDMTLALMEDIGWDVSQDGDLIGVFRNGAWFLDLNGNDFWDGCSVDGCLYLGTAGDQAVVGDWDGDGDDEIGVFRNGAWFLDLNGNDFWDGCSVDGCLYLGMTGDQAVVGDWDGDGDDEIGVLRNGAWFLDLNGNDLWDGCSVDGCLYLGMAGDQAVVGDWDGDGDDEIGVFRNGAWFLDLNGNDFWDGCSTDGCLSFGMGGDQTAAGDWDGDGDDEIGVFRNGAWFLDRNGNDQWDDCSLDGCYYLGMAGDEPLSGKW